MSRQDLELYRAALRGLLACTASERPSGDCVAGWFGDGGELLAREDSTFARSLVSYYVESVLRGDPAAVAKRCGKG